MANIEGGNDRPGMAHQLNRQSRLKGFGSMALSADYTIGAKSRIGTYFVTTGASNVTITLPAAASSTNKEITIIKVDSGAGNVVMDGNGSETINGATTRSLTTQYKSETIKCDGTAWYVVSAS